MGVMLNKLGLIENKWCMSTKDVERSHHSQMRSKENKFGDCKRKKKDENK